MKKLIISALALAIGVAVAPAGIAAAQVDDNTTEHGEHGDDPTVEGRGWLAAKGAGSVEIDMGGRLRMRVDGDVILTDHAGDMRFQIRGGNERDAEANESGLDVILNDVNGRLRVTGSDFSILVDGEVKLAAHGRGQAWLEGDGVYRTRSGDPTVWDGMVEIGGTEVEPVLGEAIVT